MTSEETANAIRVSDLFAQVLFKTLSQRVVAELSNDRVSLAQVHAMRFIWLHQNVLMGDLASGLSISYPSATNMVKRLERQGLVERMVNPADRREVEVRLTEKGLALTEQMESERVSRMAAVMSSMDSEDRECLLRGLQSFVVAAVTDQMGVAEDVCLRCGLHANDLCPVASKMCVHVCK